MAITSDRLLTEVQRQQKYLGRLPKDFTFPLFNARQALESQRASAYRNTAAATRELVDNALEAGADKIHVVFDAERGQGNRRLVDAVAVIDNGSGMLPEMARYALSWGGGTHFDDPSFIGKFGFGLPNASVNQTKRVEVYTRTARTEPFTMAWLDIHDFSEFGVQSIPEPVEAPLPAFVQRYLDRNKWSLDHGTVVVWVNPDRLTYRTPAYLKDHLVEDFGVAYRYLLVGEDQSVELAVEGKEVKPVDPLFLLPEGMYYLPPDESGAQEVLQAFLPVKYFISADTGERRLTLLDEDAAARLDQHDSDLLAVGTIDVRISRFPLGFASAKIGRREETTDAHRRFEIRKSHLGLSFVRNKREIQTLDAFPRSARDKANGLGEWPLLQAYAYHVGFEVRFPAELDEVFGITHDKQSVRPIEDFWRVLAEAEIDQIYSKEYRHQVNIRALARKATEQRPSEPTAAEQAARDAEVAYGEPVRIPENRLDEAKKRFDEEVRKRAEISGEDVERVRAAAEAEARRRTWRVDYYESEDGPFYKPDWIGSQGVVYINKKHPFYDVLYADLLDLTGGERAKQAVDLLLMTLGRAELLTKDPEMVSWYETQRKKRWSGFLEVAMKRLEQRMPSAEELVVEGDDTE